MLFRSRPYRNYDPNDPNEKSNYIYWTGDVGKDSNDERTVGRDFDSRSHIHVTADRMRGWEDQAGIDNVEQFVNESYKEIKPTPEASSNSSFLN